MTNQEFSDFADRLFIAFPSLYEWLGKTYKPEETQRVWRSTLCDCTLAECNSVLTRWTTGVLEPFEAYERDKVGLIVRSIVSADRSRASRKESQSTMNSPYRARLGQQGDHVAMGSLFDGDMAAAVKEGAVQHKRFLDEEITWPEYEVLRADILVKHKIGSL